jgi:hypothetical protein
MAADYDFDFDSDALAAHYDARRGRRSLPWHLQDDENEPSDEQGGEGE